MFCCQLEELICWLYDVAELTDSWVPPTPDAASVKAALRRYLVGLTLGFPSSPHGQERFASASTGSVQRQRGRAGPLRRGDKSLKLASGAGSAGWVPHALSGLPLAAWASAAGVCGAKSGTCMGRGTPHAARGHAAQAGHRRRVSSRRVLPQTPVGSAPLLSSPPRSSGGTWPTTGA